MKNDNRLLRHTVKEFKEALGKEFTLKPNIITTINKLVQFIDGLLIKLFNKNQLDLDNHFCLIALGSYGRKELQLYSDIDILLLHGTNLPPLQLERAQKFIQDCWDVGLEVSHQITTVSACANLAQHNVSVISTLMDMSLLCGNPDLMEELLYQTHPLHMWPSNTYLVSKQQEQQRRYDKYQETAYNLEPNIKYGPGGLRDIQTVLSISKRYFHFKKLVDGVHQGFITDKEYDELIHCQHYLWQVRFALHLLAGKAQERLSFDYQVKLAHFFKYQDKPYFLAIEQFMKDYFKVIQRNKELNEMLLQAFNESLLDDQKQKIFPLDNEFQLANNYLEVRNPRLFYTQPQALFKLFLWLTKKNSIKGVKTSTIRLIRESLFLINRSFKENPETIALFIKILKVKDPYRPLQMMNKYGVLARYLDCFAMITGQMQYDLFHTYTVDQHTLFVIRNISRFREEQFGHQFPLCHKIIDRIEKPEVLYLGALFHDIAKGRGGDHSDLGADEAERFARRHQLPDQDTHLLIWLVKNHLLMSQTAQRKDIYNPKTIEHFCSSLPYPHYLDYLYLLTVADICGTNPTLWNAWKDSLLRQLYQATKHLMEKEQLLMDENTLLNKLKQDALSLLVKEKMAPEVVQRLWDQFENKYFLHGSAQSIALHTKAILNCNQYPLVLIMPHHSQGGTEVLVYMPHRDERFTITTTILSNFNVTIQEATIMTCSNHFDLDSYIILDEKNQVFLDPIQSATIQQALQVALASPTHLPRIIPKRQSKSLSHFHADTQITFNEDHHYTQLLLITKDRTGLLAKVSQLFLTLGIQLHDAKIVTAGERVEDTFYLTNRQSHPLMLKEKQQLHHHLMEELKK